MRWNVENDRRFQVYKRKRPIDRYPCTKSQCVTTQLKYLWIFINVTTSQYKIKFTNHHTLNIISNDILIQNYLHNISGNIQSIKFHSRSVPIFWNSKNTLDGVYHRETQGTPYGIASLLKTRADLMTLGSTWVCSD